MFLTLTTPVPRDSDAVFPGENWFYYWKTASSLWRPKLEASPFTGPVIIPLNWSFHSETGERYDFAQNRPETNLARLVEVVESLGRKAIFLLPLGPAPFIINGAVPHLLARVNARDKKGVTRYSLGPEGEVYKLFSFFDPRIYQAYARFVKELGLYFSREGVASDVYGIHCGHFKDYNFHNFIEDHSKSFEQGFSRFLQAKKEESSDSFELQDVRQEQLLMAEYTQTVIDLYRDVASESIAGNWEGELKFSFLGAGPKQSFARLFQGDYTSLYCAQIPLELARGHFLSSSLLSSRVKRGVLKKQLEQEMDQNFFEQSLAANVFEDERTMRFEHLVFFELFESPKMDQDLFSWHDRGVIDCLYDRYQWCFLWHQDQKLRWNDELVDRERVLFIKGEDFDEEVFSAVLKFFMSGGKIVIDRTSLEERWQQKLETFFIENALKVEKVNIGASVHHVELGPGRMTIVEAQSIYQKNLKDRISLWRKIIETIDTLHLEIHPPEGVEVSWKTRATSASELNFEEVRRLSLYNPTSYKKKFKVILIKNFVLTKVVNEVLAQVHSTGQELEIELRPEGSVCLDIGVFS